MDPSHLQGVPQPSSRGREWSARVRFRRSCASGQARKERAQR